MSTIFLFIKFFENEQWAMDFVKGKLFCNTLGTFKKIEASDDCGRADRNEGTTAWLQPGQTEVVINGFNMSDDAVAPFQVQMDHLNDLHLLCMHACHSGALDLNRLSTWNIADLRRELIVPNACLKLGTHAVVVREVRGFIERMHAAAQAQGYGIYRRLVRYYDPESFHGEFRDVEAVFRKQERFSYQREFRFAINTGRTGDLPLTLDIGDISGITMRLRSDELNGPKLLGGQLAFARRR